MRKTYFSNLKKFRHISSNKLTSSLRIQLVTILVNFVVFLIGFDEDLSEFNEVLITYNLSKYRVIASRARRVLGVTAAGPVLTGHDLRE